MKKLLIILILCISHSVSAGIKLSSKELSCLTKNAFFEANLEGDIGMMLVTNVVLNRTHDGKYCKTIFKKYQFAWTSGKTKKIPVDTFNSIAFSIKKFNRRALPIRLVGATHYHKRGEHPNWARKLKRLGAYKNHIFYKET
jgi:hypothetical protein